MTLAASKRQPQRLPDVDQRLDQAATCASLWRRRRGDAQALCPLGDGRIVDRLDVDRVALEQQFARRAAFSRVADNTGTICEGLSITGRPAARSACLTSRAMA